MCYYFSKFTPSQIELAMKSTTTTPTSPSKTILRLFLVITMRVTKKVTSHVKEYTCKCCKRQLTTNGNGKLTELTPKFQEIDEILADIYTRRMSRLKKKTLSSSIY